MTKYAHSGEPTLRNLKGALWRLEEDCQIDSGVRGYPFALAPLPPAGARRPSIDQAWTWRDLDGLIRFKAGYIFDGTSMPLIGRWFDAAFVKSWWPPLIHDAEHEGMRAGQTPQSQFRPAAERYGDAVTYFSGSNVVGALCCRALLMFGAPSARRQPEYEFRRLAA